MFVTLTLATFEPENRRAFLDAARTYARQSMASERGCRRIDVLSDDTSHGRLILFSVYEDADAFEDHCGTEHARRFEDACEAWATSRQVMRLRPEPLD